MRKVEEVLRLTLEQKLSVRQVAASCGLARSTVSDYLGRARVAGLGWPLPEGIDEARLEELLFPPRPASGPPQRTLDLPYIHRELKRKHVTLQLLWEEYRGREPKGYGYSQYCQLYGRWARTLSPSLRQEHRAGEKLFVDYSGDTVSIVDPHTGEVTQAHLFVAVLGCSNYTYAELTASEGLEDWLGAHVRALEFLGGVPRILVPDNAKTAVRRPCWYDPELNLSYQELAEHYQVAIVPARPRKPKDKAKVEGGVLVAHRWILARLRDLTLFGLAEGNRNVIQLLRRLNEHAFKKLPGNRLEAFVQLDQPALRSLPVQPYEFARWKQVGVNIDYHVEVEGHYYSAPYHLLRHRLMARYTASTLELFQQSKRVAVHVRRHEKGRHSTLAEHRPPAHREHLEWTPERVLSWAGTIGPGVEAAVAFLMKSRAYPEEAFRPSLGIIRLAKRFGNERVDKACAWALELNIVTYRRIETILRNRREKPAARIDPPNLTHPNLRGPTYYA